MLDFLAIFTVFAPLLAACIVGLSTRICTNAIASLICVLCMLISFCSAVTIFQAVVFEQTIIHLKLLPWLQNDYLQAYWSIYIDVLTAVMLLVVTAVSSLVHIYSIGYMSHDPHQPRFMAYLSLFTFCMLMLVSSDNFLQLFFGWEGVGLSSYLLIGFWFTKQTANNAAIKAFLINRVGDLGFIIGIFMIFILCDSVEFTKVFAFIRENSIDFNEYDIFWLDIACFCLFMGCMGKSAQIGLHTWLPDAMEGPTPVSALIHAATMVTAGVFLLARCSHIFEFATQTMTFITYVGAITCIFAASIALVQDDIKKIIAYSTCSQLGYMFFACGVSAYPAAVFHLATHAFFKALLFLGVGSVIHGLSDEQNIKKMGGIWRLMPFTYILMWIGSLALAGIYPFAGFYSKDLILEAAYAAGTTSGIFAYWIGIIAAIMTAFYSWRLLILVFHGKKHMDHSAVHNIHESPIIMLLPLALLAFGAISTGFIGVKIGISDLDFWRTSIYISPEHGALLGAHHVPRSITIMPMIAGVLGIIIAYSLYNNGLSAAHSITLRFRALYTALCNKWYFDTVYDWLFVRSAKFFGQALWRWIDVNFIDSFPNGAAGLSLRFSKLLKILQTGYVYHYAFLMLTGMLLIITSVLYKVMP